VVEALKPPFTYFGGKLKLAERIADLLPPHQHYIEPFAGSLSVLLAKPPSPMETVNDLDGNLMNFWRMLRDRPDELERACALTPHSRAEYQACYEPATDDLERARRVWVNLTQGRGGQMKRTGWRFYQDPRGSHSSMPDYLAAYVARICPAAARLANVSLECKDALDIIREYGRHPDTLLYCDPPYLASLRSLNHGRCRGPDYDHELRSDDEHTELLDALLGCRAAVVLSGYTSELYDGLLTTWFRREIATQTGNGGSDRARTEVLWSNRPWPQGSLFDQIGEAS
jgi:DNA adenine methylase